MNPHSLPTQGRRLLPAARGATVAAALLAMAGTQAAVLNFEFNNLNLAIPDGSSSGVADTRQLAAAPGPVVDVNVTLRIRPRDGTSVYNGDLYAALTHESGYAVLLNRAGRRPGSALGYGDNGFDAAFDDEAANGDVHQYRLTLNGTHAGMLQPAPSALEGTWSPDGRLVPPAQATLGDARTALLGSFDGLAVAGNWTLFVVDWETGGLAALDSWGLQITVVPEPAAVTAMAAAGLAAFAGVRAWRRRLTNPQSAPASLLPGSRGS